MPNINQLPIITNASSTLTSLLVVDNRVTKRIPYNSLVGQVFNDISASIGTIQGVQGLQGIQGVQSVQGIQGPRGVGGTGIPKGGSIGQSLVKLSSSDYDTGWATVVGISSVSRTNITATTANLASNTTATVDVTGFKTYVLSKVATTYPAWVRIYTDSASRTSDSTRSSGTDPLPGSGIIAEVITTSGGLTQLITPGIIGFNNDTVNTSTIYLAITNKDSVTRSVSATLSLLKLE